MLSIHNLPDSIDLKTAQKKKSKSKREKKRRKTTITQSNWALCSCPVASLSVLCTHEINQLIVKLSNRIKFCFIFFFFSFSSVRFQMHDPRGTSCVISSEGRFVRFIFYSPSFDTNADQRSRRGSMILFFSFLFFPSRIRHQIQMTKQFFFGRC